MMDASPRKLEDENDTGLKIWKNISNTSRVDNDQTLSRFAIDSTKSIKKQLAFQLPLMDTQRALLSTEFRDDLASPRPLLNPNYSQSELRSPLNTKSNSPLHQKLLLPKEKLEDYLIVGPNSEDNSENIANPGILERLHSESIQSKDILAKPMSYDLNIKEDKQSTTVREDVKRMKDELKKIGTSSCVTMLNRKFSAKQLKLLLQNPPASLIMTSTNTFGYFGIFGLTLLLLICYFIMEDNYYKFSLFVQIAPFPSYLATVMKSINSNVETAIGLNNGFYPTNQSTFFSNNVKSTIKDRIARFMDKYNLYVLNFDVETLAPNFRYSKYTMNISLPIAYEQPQNLSFFEASKIFLGIIYRLNYTSLNKIASTTPEVIWMRNYNKPFIDTFEAMRSTLYNDFYGQYEHILSLLDVILIVGILTTVVLALSLILTFKLLERKGIFVLSRVTKIQNSEIIKVLESMQEEHKIHFGAGIDAIQSNVDLLGKKKSSLETLNSSRKAFKVAGVSWAKISLGAALFICYSLAFYLVTTLLYKSQTKGILPFIKNVDILTQATPYTGWSRGISMYFLNIYNNSSLASRAEFYNGIWSQYDTINQKIITLYQSADSTVINSRFASQILKQRYINMSNEALCYDVIQNANYYNTCLTGFNNASHLGFANIFSTAHNAHEVIKDKALANINLTGVLNITKQGTLIKDLISYAVIADSVTVNSSQIEAQNLSVAMITIKDSVKWFLVGGLLVMSSLLFLGWRPVSRFLAKELREMKAIYAVIPMNLIARNIHVMNALEIKQRFKNFEEQS